VLSRRRVCPVTIHVPEALSLARMTSGATRTPPRKTREAKPRERGATLRDIAEHAGVHQTTASRALDPQRRHHVSAEVARRVDLAVRSLDYRINRAASALRTGRSRTIGVLVPDITNPVFPPMLRGIEHALATEGMFAMVADIEAGRSSIEVADLMRAQGVDGFIIATSQRDEPLVARLHAAGVKVVQVNRRDESGEVPAVVSDDILGMRLAVDHLVGFGHRRIAHLAGPPQFSTGHLRKAGFLQALHAHRLKAAGSVDCSAYSVAAGAEAMARLARRDVRFTGVVAANDLIAIGAILELRRRGVVVPHDVSIVGHNDMPLVDMVSPALTTVRIQHYEMGRRAARLLLDELSGVNGLGRLGGPGADPVGAATIVLRPELVVRDSSAPPRA
jgi:LacI family transcriptional regulator